MIVADVVSVIVWIFIGGDRAGDPPKQPRNDGSAAQFRITMTS